MHAFNIPAVTLVPDFLQEPNTVLTILSLSG